MRITSESDRNSDASRCPPAHMLFYLASFSFSDFPLQHKNRLRPFAVFSFAGARVRPLWPSVWAYRAKPLPRTGAKGGNPTVKTLLPLGAAGLRAGSDAGQRPRLTRLRPR